MSRHPVRVVIRDRPVSGGGSSVELGADGRTVRVISAQRSTSFSYDTVLDGASQERTFEEVGRPLCETVMQGVNATVLCYGQTGAGKSFTMVGNGQDYHTRGILPRALASIFRGVADRPEYEYTLRLQCLEIYNDSMYDLLSTLPGAQRSELSLSSSSEVVGLTSPKVSSEQEAHKLVFEAEANRAVEQHKLNARSSRSHVLYMLLVERRSRVDSSGAVLKSRLTLADLAGSERLKKSGDHGDEGFQPPSSLNLTGVAPTRQQRLARESMCINKSLSFLEQVVIALGSKRPSGHVPHRSSRLTAVLRDSLGGNCRTVLIANIRTDDVHVEETFSTCRFAQRMAGVSTTATVNTDIVRSPEEEMRRCRGELADLKRELAMHDQLAGRTSVAYSGAFSSAERDELRAQIQGFVAGGPEARLEPRSLRQINEAFAIFKQLIREGEDQRSAASSQWECPRCGAAAAEADPADEPAVILSATFETPAPEVVLVGDDSATGFAVGEAPADARPSDGITVVAARATNPPSSSPAAEPSRGAEGASSRGATAGSSRDQAYDTFKAGPGRELAIALAEGKKGLREKRVVVRQLSQDVNAATRTIGECKDLLERKRQHRSGGGAERSTSADGEPVDVIDEEEYLCLTRLKATKHAYREAFDRLVEARAQVDLTEQVVETCRAQLVADFEAWGGSDLGGEAATPAVSADSGPDEALDQDEEYEAMAEERILKADPESLAFFNAVRQAQSSGRSPARTIRRR